MASGTAANAAEATARSTNSGTYLVIIGDITAGWNGAGNYRTSLAKTGSTPDISLSDDGGPMNNGTTYQGAIDLGDIDAWTFTANAGESFVVRMGETTTTALTPQVRIFGPDGVLVDSANAANAAEVTARSTNSGTYLVIVGDVTASWNGSGNYRLSLAKTGSALAISSATDEGGSMVNGTTYGGIIDVGDIDGWTFTASVGDSIIVRMGETTTTALTPQLRLYGPNGVLLDSSSAGSAAEVTTRATNNGTFLIVAGDVTSGWNGSGNYRLTLAKTGSAPVISPTDEGGPMVNGLTYVANINTGDFDAWTFTANPGDSIIVRMGELTSATLTPQLRLFAPDGTSLDARSAGAAAEVTAQATIGGQYLLVAADISSGWAGIGDYRLNLALSPETFSVSPGDDGGALPQQGSKVGEITTGDIDLWSFEANAGNSVNITMQEQNTTALTPWLRLYDVNGQLLLSRSGGASAQIPFTVLQSGLYVVVASDLSSGWAGTGTYELSVTGLPEQGKQLRYEYSRSNPQSLLLNWPSELAGYVLQENPVLQSTGWSDITEGPFDNRLNVRITIPIPATGNRFYRLRPPVPQ